MKREHYTFNNLLQLREFLNAFKATDLETVLPEDSDYIDFAWITQTLTDGNEIADFKISHVEHHRGERA